LPLPIAVVNQKINPFELLKNDKKQNLISENPVIDALVSTAHRHSRQQWFLFSSA